MPEVSVLQPFEKTEKKFKAKSWKPPKAAASVYEKSLEITSGMTREQQTLVFYQQQVKKAQATVRSLENKVKDATTNHEILTQKAFDKLLGQLKKEPLSLRGQRQEIFLLRMQERALKDELDRMAAQVQEQSSTLKKLQSVFIKAKLYEKKQNRRPARFSQDADRESAKAELEHIQGRVQDLSKQLEQEQAKIKEVGEICQFAFLRRAHYQKFCCAFQPIHHAPFSSLARTGRDRQLFPWTSHLSKFYTG